MKIVFLTTLSNIENEPLELVERKGIGHPDTLSDILADTFSNKYSQYSLQNYGSILNHTVDKVTLLGAKAHVDFGTGVIEKPITACLFGKASLKVNGNILDIENIFKKSVEEVFVRVFHTKKILNYIQYHINVHDGIGFDHPKGFYSPVSVSDVKRVNAELRSNDTVMCSGYAPYSRVEKLAIDLENFLNSESFKSEYHETGFDIKVMITRLGQDFIDVTACIPFIASKTSSMAFYRKRLKEIENLIQAKIHKLADFKNVSLHVNTKDENGKYAYLTVFGSALDKGDQGAVGRGNRYNGVIAVNREMNVEAASGKNPLHHSGKIYNVISHNISQRIFRNFGLWNTVFISAKNGDFLNKPSYVVVKTTGSSNRHKEITRIVNRYLNNLQDVTKTIINSDPIDEHINKSFK